MGADRIKKRSSAKVSDKIIFYSSAIFSSVLNNNLNKYMKTQVQAALAQIQFSPGQRKPKREKEREREGL